MPRSITFPVHRQVELRELAVRSKQVVLMAAVTGVVTGLLVAAYEAVVVELAFEHVDDLPVAAVAAAPAVGLLLCVAIRRLVGGPNTPAASADEYLLAFHDGDRRLPVRQWAARWSASIAALGSGVPMGLEGPSVYTGAVVGSNLQRRFPNTFRDADRRVLMVAGAAAGVAAIFKAPATGAVFALEVPFQDDVARRMLLPALVASASGYLAFAAVHGTDSLFDLGPSAGFEFRDLLGAIAVGIVAGLAARAFAKLLRVAKAVNGSRHHVLLAGAAGASLAGLFLVGLAITDEHVVFGPGYNVIAWTSDPDRALWVIVAVLGLRCLATATAVAGGAVGGLFVPLVVAGALTGSLVGHLVNHDDLGLFIIVGVAAFLGAGYRVPLAAVMFVAETTGRPAYVVPGLLASVAAELMMGRSSVTTYQLAQRRTD